MAYLKFLDSKNILQCVIKKISSNVISLSFSDEIVVDTSGFRLYMDAKCENDIGGTTYEKFKTIYRNDDETAKSSGYQLSNDGSAYEKPTYTVSFSAGNGGELDGLTTQSIETYEELVIPKPVPNENYEFSAWSPSIPQSGDVDKNVTYTAQFVYLPTLEEIKESKIKEMNAIQQEAIRNGLDITLSDGTVEHFTLTENDQTSLMGLQTRVLAGDERIPWHDSNIETGCKYYSNTDMKIITEKAMAFVTWHVTYFVNLRVYILMLQEKEEVEAIEYGTYIPEEYQDEVMRDLYAIS